MKVQIMGAGSLGSLVGGILARGGLDVVLVGRRPHVEAVNDSGLRVTGELDFTVHPDVSTTPTDADVTLVTVKSYDTRDAARQLGDETVVSLQNGMGNEEVLDDELDGPVLAGTTTYGANLVGSGTVECTGIGEVDIGNPDGGFSDDADALADAFDDAGLVTRSRDDMPERLWRKLAVNAGINPVTALTRLTNGEAADAAEWVVRAAAEETATLARSYGVEVTDAGDAALRVARATAGNESSMLQDVKRGRRTEIEAINGYVVENAGGEDVRINTALLRLVEGLERGVR